MESFYQFYNKMMKENGMPAPAPGAPAQPQAPQPQAPKPMGNAVSPPEGIDQNIQQIQQLVAKLDDKTYGPLKGQITQLLTKKPAQPQAQAPQPAPAQPQAQAPGQPPQAAPSPVQPR